MKDRDKNWIIQWRYNPEDSKRERMPWELEWRKRNVKRWHATAYFPKKNKEYLYSVSSAKKATLHTLEEAMKLWFMMRNNWKFDESMNRSWGRARLVRLYNTKTKEEIYPSQLDPGCVGEQHD